MKMIVCDKCKKEVEDDDCYDPEMSVLKIFSHEMDGGKIILRCDHQRDLCEDCVLKFMEEIDGDA